MPLHAEREGGRIGDAHGLDGAVGCDRFHDQAFAEAIDRLPVQRIDLDRVGAIKEFLQAPAGRQCHRVRRTIAFRQGHGLVGAMVEAIRQFVHFLMQRTPERDVQLLHPAADGEQRHTLGQSATDQGQGSGVARRIPGAAGPARLRPIVMWFDVGRAAGDQQAVELIEQRVEIKPRPQGGNQQWQAARAIDDGIDIFVAHLVVTEAIAVNEAGRHADDGGTIVPEHARFYRSHRKSTSCFSILVLHQARQKQRCRTYWIRHLQDSRLDQAASTLWPSMTLGCGLASVAISILCGFMASGSSRTSSMSSRPLLRRAPVTFT